MPWPVWGFACLKGLQAAGPHAGWLRSAVAARTRRRGRQPGVIATQNHGSGSRREAAICGPLQVALFALDVVGASTPAQVFTLSAHHIDRQACHRAALADNLYQPSRLARTSPLLTAYTTQHVCTHTIQARVTARLAGHQLCLKPPPTGTAPPRSAMRDSRRQSLPVVPVVPVPQGMSEDNVLYRVASCGRKPPMLTPSTPKPVAYEAVQAVQACYLGGDGYNMWVRAWTLRAIPACSSTRPAPLYGCVDGDVGEAAPSCRRSPGLHVGPEMWRSHC
eukprot:366497-Chlamydomonas_euryale.AAC.11